MTAKVLDFTGSNTLDLDPKEVVEALGRVDFSRILVIGYDENEELVCHSETKGYSSLQYRWIYSDGTESQEYPLGALDASSPT